MVAIRMIVLMSCCTLVLSLGAQTSPPQAHLEREAIKGLKLTPSASEMKHWESSLPGIELIIEEDSTGLRLPAERFRVVEGDIILPKPIAEEYEEKRSGHAQWLERKGSSAVMILVPIHSGRKLLWPNGKTIRYSISAPTFAGYDRIHASVVAAIDSAAREWEALCNIRFEHVAHEDARAMIEPKGDLDLVVAMLRDPNYPDAAYWARLRQGVMSSTVFITSTFPGPVTPLMLMRHELGHALGFLHEGNRAPVPSDCLRDVPGPIAPIGEYCAHSVMHQVCGNKKAHLYAFTPLDRCAAAQCYPFQDVPFNSCEGTELPCVNDNR